MDRRNKKKLLGGKIMDIKLQYSITTDEFLEMVESVGWKTYTKKQV